MSDPNKQGSLVRLVWRTTLNAVLIAMTLICMSFAKGKSLGIGTLAVIGTIALLTGAVGAALWERDVNEAKVKQLRRA